MSTPRAITGAAVFLVAYLAVSFAGALADRSLPLPDAPAADVAAYYGANPAAAVVVALLQVVSVLGFAAFAWVVSRGPARAVAAVSVLAMVVSSALTVVLAIVAGSASLDTVQTLRLGSFYAGGVVNVVTLGIFVVTAANQRVGAPTRWFGYVAGGLAVLSVLSPAFSFASALLPVGRVLSMVWTVVAAIVLARSRRTGRAVSTRGSAS
ncbi:hypothetical protein QRX60_33740 [Amycolatopsis mongoliensis]|uniref:DUF4386 domain-containing protein n=1 Tax=Amycolatopsis mongoliensis TaxID=715475 RepID=A0A9Y2NAV5_9PSEU|nr:hypothetical protein [Amycolatopsis sp. 4-36]WIX98995.1 hypothetical protein QRX60_33740 [Amycolatopsis sp. 4-36]